MKGFIEVSTFENEKSRPININNIFSYSDYTITTNIIDRYSARWDNHLMEFDQSKYISVLYTLTVEQTKEQIKKLIEEAQ